MDVIFKDAEFSIGIEEFKKEQKEFEIKNKKKPKKDKRKKPKYKIVIPKKDDRSYRSSDSSLSES